MKKILTGIALLLLLYVGTLLYSRHAAEETLNDIADYITAFPGYSASVEQVNHGLFSSKAILNLKLDTAALAGGLDPAEQELINEQLAFLEAGLNVNLDIYRGPLVFHDGVSPGLYKVIATLDEDIGVLDAALGEAFNLNDYFSFVAEMNYFGEGTADFDIVEFNRDIGDTRLEWAGMNHQYRLQDYGSSYVIDGVAHPIVVSDGANRFESASMLFSGEGQLPPAGTFVADSRISMSLPFMFATAEGGEIFRLEDLAASVDMATADDDTFSFNYGIGTGSIVAPTLPEDINRLRVDFGANDMSIAGFNNFYTTALEASNNADPAQGQAQVVQAMAGLMAGNPEFLLNELDFSMGSDKELRLSARLRLGEHFMTNAAMAMMNPVSMLDTVELEVSMRFTRPMLEAVLQSYVQNQLAALELDPQSLQLMQEQQLMQMNAMILQAVQAGFLVQEGDRLVVEANLTGGNASVNGMPVPLPQL